MLKFECNRFLTYRASAEDLPLCRAFSLQKCMCKGNTCNSLQLELCQFIFIAHMVPVIAHICMVLVKFCLHDVVAVHVRKAECNCFWFTNKVGNWSHGKMRTTRCCTDILCSTVLSTNLLLSSYKAYVGMHSACLNRSLSQFSSEWQQSEAG